MSSEPVDIRDAAIEVHWQSALRLLAEHEAAAQSSLQKAIACGAKLHAIKATCSHGEWIKQLNIQWPRSIELAQKFMLLAAPANKELVTYLPEGTSYHEALDRIADQKRIVRIGKARAALPSTNDDPLERWDARVGDARHLPLDDNSVGVWIGSPPYNARIDYEGYTDWLPWDEWWEGLIVPSVKEAARVLRPGGRFCLNLANVVRSNVGQRERPVPAAELQKTRNASRGPNGRKWTVSRRRLESEVSYRARGGKKWSPPGAGGESWAFLMAPLIWKLIEDVGLLQREQITWIKGADPENVVTTSTAWGSWLSHSNPVLRAVAEPVFIADKGTHAYERDDVAPDLTGDEQKLWCRNAWFIPNEGGTVSRWGAHPAPFPVELPRRLSKLYGWPGDLVVDPFMGLAATGEAALRVGRRFYGCDISPVYVDRARARLDAVCRELIS